MSQDDIKQSKSGLFNQIATELWNADQILKQVDATKDTRPRKIAFEPPRTPIQRKLAAIYADLLGLEEVGIYDDFFQLGGDSILATQVLSRVFDIFQVEIPLDHLFTGTFAIAELAEIIQDYQIKQADPEEVAAAHEELNRLSDDQVKAMLASEEPD